MATRLPSATALQGLGVERDGQFAPLNSWHAHLLTLDRRQCVLFCHDATRYVLFMPGLRAPQLAELGRWHRDLFLAVLQAQGLAHHHIAHAGLRLGPLQMDRSTDRSVLSSMNRVAGDLQFGLLRETSNVMELDPIKTSLWLNDRPCTVHKKWIWPDKAMREIVEAL
ncbi:MAG: hypothetical protein HOP00_04510 [Nitrospira sp.]|nr:hypothetical protein [Nitrospira sp.]